MYNLSSKLPFRPVITEVRGGCICARWLIYAWRVQYGMYFGIFAFTFPSLLVCGSFDAASRLLLPARCIRAVGSMLLTGTAAALKVGPENGPQFWPTKWVH